MGLCRSEASRVTSCHRKIDDLFFFADIITENGEDISFSAVFQKMVEEGFEDLPPGGGIHSK